MIRDPHEPVVPGNENFEQREASHHTMPLGSQGPLRDPHEPVLPEGVKAPALPSAADLDVVEAEKPKEGLLHKVEDVVKDAAEGIVEAATSGLGALHGE